MCKKVGIDNDDLEYMTLGMCLDYIDEFIEQTNPNRENPARKASQVDFDSF